MKVTVIRGIPPTQDMFYIDLFVAGMKTTRPTIEVNEVDLFLEYTYHNGYWHFAGSVHSKRSQENIAYAESRDAICNVLAETAQSDAIVLACSPVSNWTSISEGNPVFCLPQRVQNFVFRLTTPDNANLESRIIPTVFFYQVDAKDYNIDFAHSEDMGTILSMWGTRFGSRLKQIKLMDPYHQYKNLHHPSYTLSDKSKVLLEDRDSYQAYIYGCTFAETLLPNGTTKQVLSMDYV